MAEGVIVVKVRLTPEHAETALELGSGNLSAGIRRALEIARGVGVAERILKGGEA